MFGFLKKLFGGKQAEVVAEAPYKVEAPVAEQLPLVQLGPEKENASAKPAPKKKPAGRKPAGPKPAQKPAAPKQGAAKRGGRKPKSKTQA